MSKLLIFIIVLTILTVIVLLVVFALKNLKNHIFRKINHFTRNSFGTNYSELSILGSALSSAYQDQTPQQKSVSGATSFYLGKIIKDFPDFHNADAETAIENFLFEFLQIKYQNKSDFANSKVDKGLISRIVSEKQSGNYKIDNIKYNKISISNYIKNDDVATITYQVSIGFNLNGERQEKRFTIEYTLRLIEDNIASNAYICPNCGATIENTSETKCPYCDCKLTRNTVFNWLFTSITEG